MNAVRHRLYEIDRESPLPIYHQLKEIIKAKIERGEFAPGERIPTEYELCEAHGISRTPVRQALTELVNEGLLLRLRGRGTFVNGYSYLNVRPVKAIIPEKRWSSPLEKAVEIWNSENPGSRVKLDISLVGYPQFRFKIIAAVARGEAPDLALIDSVWMAEFAELEYLQPLDELDREWIERDFKKDFFPSFASNFFRGHLYGIPPEADVAGVWFRRDWFTLEGISPPRNWGELLTATQHFKKKKIRNRYGLGDYPLAFPGGLEAGETTSYILLPLLWSAGEEVFVDGKINLGEGARQVLSFLVDLVHRYKVAAPKVISCEWNRAPILFGQGQTALSFGGSYEKFIICQAAGWGEEEFKKRVGFLPFPAGPKGTATTMASGMVYSIFRQSKAHRQALEILKRAVSPGVMKDFCCSTGQNPPRISVARALDPQKDWFLYNTSRLLYNARVRPLIPEYAAVSEQLQAMMENALSCRMTVEEAVGWAEQVIGAIMSGIDESQLSYYGRSSIPS
ncbi:MAG: extracellular solute-binding protein [Candidatus Bipolaricaulota bacterium]|nr:extracellular solute-binding protein [Candidatus Bipolaricaulota bacterium]